MDILAFILSKLTKTCLPIQYLIVFIVSRDSDFGTILFPGFIC
jgi:hypothetical protein